MVTFQWRTVWLETVPGSEERINVGLVLSGHDSPPLYYPILSQERALSMFGATGAGMQTLLDATQESIVRQLGEDVSPDSLELPFGNLGLSGAREISAASSKEAVWFATRMSSAFASDEKPEMMRPSCN